MFSQRPKGSGLQRQRVETSTATLPLFASAMRQARVEPAVPDDGRPEYFSTGLVSIDRALRGGFRVGELTLVAARLKVGATSLLLGAALAAMQRGERVAYLSERLSEEQLRGRLVVLESRVNGFRFSAGFVSADDRLALAAARERIGWNHLALRCRETILPRDIDAHIFSYRPGLVVADVRPRGEQPSRDLVAAQLQGLARLRELAAKHQTALVVRVLLAKGAHPPDIVELPGVGRAADHAGAVILLHRNVDDTQGGTAQASIVRVAGHEVTPREVSLRFDQRFAGLLDPV